MFKFKASDLPEILTLVGAVFGIRPEPDNARCASGRAVRKEVGSWSRTNTNLIVAPKGIRLRRARAVPAGKATKDLYRHQRASSSSLQKEDKILFGLRPCDTYGLAYGSKLFLGEHHDINYHLRRQHVFIVAVNCLEAGRRNATAPQWVPGRCGNHRPPNAECRQARV